MKHATFAKLVQNRMAGCENVLCSKDKEYSSEADRLHNFVQAGKARGESSIKALDGMLMKHIVSFWDIVDNMENDDLYIPSLETVAEKLGDIHNYLFLAEGLIEDRRECLYGAHIEKAVEQEEEIFYCPGCNIRIGDRHKPGCQVFEKDRNSQIE